MSERMTPERREHLHTIAKYHADEVLQEVLAELDAVTRERDEARDSVKDLRREISNW